jgi:hypothetical protein
MAEMTHSASGRYGSSVVRACLWVPALVLGLLGCGTDPEHALIGRWKEVGWRYDKIDRPEAQGKWIDGIRFRSYSDRQVVRHEAEYWDFKPGRALEITHRNGDRLEARWRLKGRGHVLTIQHPDSGEFEVYDVKELTPDEMVLHYDMGLEVRGIARLEFRRASTEELSTRAARPSATGADRS